MRTPLPSDPIPFPHRTKQNLLTPSCREGDPSQGTPRRVAMTWLGKVSQEQMPLKKKKPTKTLQVGGGKQRSPFSC